MKVKTYFNINKFLTEKEYNKINDLINISLIDNKIIVELGYGFLLWDLMKIKRKIIKELKLNEFIYNKSCNWWEKPKDL